MGKIRKNQTLGLALIAMLTLSAAITTSAFAALEFTLAQWLINGARLTAEHLTDSVGELLVENVLLGAQFQCSQLYEGTVGPESADLTTMIYTLEPSQRLIEELAGEALLCTNEKTCEKAERWPTNLPWTTELELDTTEEKFYELTKGTGGEPGYHISCTVLGVKVEELCETAAGSILEVKNVTGGVEAVGRPEPNGPCGSNSEENALFYQVGNLTTSPDGTLTVSE